MKKVVATRKKYRTPELTEYGNITDLTQATDTGIGDNLGGGFLSGTST